MSDLNITNEYGIRLCDIHPGDKVRLDCDITCESIDRIEMMEVAGIGTIHKLWGFWGSERRIKQYGQFTSIDRHEPQFKPYDPTQVGDREDDI